MARPEILRRLEEDMDRYDAHASQCDTCRDVVAAAVELDRLCVEGRRLALEVFWGGSEERAAQGARRRGGQ